MLWEEMCQGARIRHLEALMALRPIEARSILVPDGYLYCIRSADLWEAEPYTLETRLSVTEMVIQRARRIGASGVGMVVQGVTPEQEPEGLFLRPALLTTVMGLNEWDQWRFEISQRVHLAPDQVTAFGPVVRLASFGHAGEWMPDVSSMFIRDWPEVVWRQSHGG